MFQEGGFLSSVAVAPKHNLGEQILPVLGGQQTEKPVGTNSFVIVYLVGTIAAGIGLCSPGR